MKTLGVQPLPSMSMSSQAVGFQSNHKHHPPIGVVTLPVLRHPEQHKEKPLSFLTKVWDGLVRMTRMAFLRPMGWLETFGLHGFSLFTTGGVMNVVPFALFNARHFLEGFMHVDSLVLPRINSPFNKLSGAKAHGRSFIGKMMGAPDKSTRKAGIVV